MRVKGIVEWGVEEDIWANTTDMDSIVEKAPYTLS